jgi:hypothetical protein
MLKSMNRFLQLFAVICLSVQAAPAAPLQSPNGGRALSGDHESNRPRRRALSPTYYGKRSLYNQNADAEPLSWALSGPALDTVTASFQRPYYEALGYSAAPRNFIYYDWNW